MAGLSEDGEIFVWSVSMRTKPLGKIRSMTYERWWNSKEAAIKYAEESERKGHEVQTVIGWQQREYIDWKRDRASNTNRE